MKTAMNTNARTNIPATGKGFGIKASSSGKIIGLLTSLYSSPVTPVRELIVNAIEAKNESGENRPVEVEIKTEMSAISDNILGKSDGSVVISSATFTIRDYGVGMDSKMFHDVFLNIAESTKDTSDETVGGFGIGSKAIFMLTDTVTYTSTKDGETTRSIVSLNSDGTEDNTVSQATNLPNGTTITFDLDGEKARAVIDRIGSEFLDYQDPNDVLVTLDGKSVEVGKNGTLAMKPGEAKFSMEKVKGSSYDESTEVTILGLGGIAYKYRINNLYDKLLRYVENDEEKEIAYANYRDIFGFGKYVTFAYKNLVIRLDVTRDNINPSRETCISSEELDNRCVEAIIEKVTSVYEMLKSEIHEKYNFEDWRKAVLNIEDKELRSAVVNKIYKILDMTILGGEDENKYLAPFTSNKEVKAISSDRYFYGSQHVTYKDFLSPEDRSSKYIDFLVDNGDVEEFLSSYMFLIDNSFSIVGLENKAGAVLFPYPIFEDIKEITFPSLTKKSQIVNRLFNFSFFIDKERDVRKDAINAGRALHKKLNSKKKKQSDNTVKDFTIIAKGTKSRTFHSVADTVKYILDNSDKDENVVVLPIECEIERTCIENLMDSFFRITNANHNVVFCIGFGATASLRRSIQSRKNAGHIMVKNHIERYVENEDEAELAGAVFRAIFPDGGSTFLRIRDHEDICAVEYDILDRVDSSSLVAKYTKKRAEDRLEDIKRFEQYTGLSSELVMYKRRANATIRESEVKGYIRSLATPMFSNDQDPISEIYKKKYGFSLADGVDGAIEKQERKLAIMEAVENL